MRASWLRTRGIMGRCATSPRLPSLSSLSPQVPPRASGGSHQRDILREFTALLALPNLASDGANIERNAAAIVAMLERRGVATRVLRLEGRPPIVIGHARRRRQRRRLGCGEGDPEWRLYARSAGDDKAPIVAMMAALDAMREA